MEIWKDIVGYEGRYQISNLGNVMSLNFNGTGKPLQLKKNPDSSGYLQVKLYRNGIDDTFSVHKLVAEHFLDLPQNYKELDVNHIDENILNNSATNLEFTTHIDNVRHGTGIARGRKKLRKKVLCIELDMLFDSRKVCAEFFGVNPTNITNCCKGRQKSCRGYHFKDVLA